MRGFARKDAEAGGGAFDPEALRWFASLVRPYAGRLAIAGVALTLSGGVSLVLPWFMGTVVDTVLVAKVTSRIDELILGLVGIFAVSGVLDFVETYALRSTAADLLTELRARLHAHLLTLSPGFFESQRTGELLSRLNSDVDQIGGALTGQLVAGIQQAFVLVGALVILIRFHAGLTGVMLLAVPPVILAAAFFGRRFRQLSKDEREAIAESNVAAEEAIAGIRTVQAFAQEPHERERFRARVDRALEISLRAARAWGAFGGVIRFVAFSAIALVCWYGGRLVVQEELTPGRLTSFLAYTMTVAGAVGTLTALYGSYRTVTGATERVRQLLDTKPTIADAPDAVTLGRARGKVELEGVSFSYPSNPDRRALDGVTLAVEPGQCLALVGPSGAGKSTLVSLLLRFHDPASGRVLLDGEDVRRYRLADLRRAIGLVPQEIVLFGGTVAENVRYGRPGSTDAEVRAACEAAQAHGFIDALPRKYDSVVGERGVKLSAGERQRIAIARVLLKDPGVVILDEATSSLDSESEHLIQKAFDRLLEGRTTIVIAHRLTTVRRASRVVLLQQGAVLEAGTHEALLAANGLYRRLCELQLIAPGATAS